MNVFRRQTVNKEYYVCVMRRLSEAIYVKMPQIRADNSWFWYQDNTLPHTALVFREHFAKNSTHIAPQPPYWSDLPPLDFYLSKNFKRPLRGHNFNWIEKIKAKSKKALKVFSEKDFSDCFGD
ncbi:uncharacterized protein [Euwallacea fornicatus]|uniref:uncharacterized protein n=1 Tax=Euwallacea fornicatus TaxID=995702 RepID=UPI00338E5742